jgi:penicillin G amidase
MMTDVTQARRIAVLEVLRGELTEDEACAREACDRQTYRSWERSLLTGKLRADDGELTSAALRQGGRIIRDRWGVAHCTGESIGDLCFAAGVAQAQDRLWQLDYRRRLASGQLAAILGEKHLATDREHRTIGFRRIVEQSELPVLEAEAAEALTGYAAGVNAWMDVVRHNLPIEFDVLEYEPEPWTVTDSLAILRYFWWTLTGRLSQLVAAERLLRGASPQLCEWFMTPETISTIVPGHGDTAAGWAEGLQASGSAAADDPSSIPGSNNWVAGRQLLQSGGPVLAADPHWPLSFPDMWYEQHLCGAGLDVIGPAYPGAPPVIFGRTRGMAWGRTNNVSSTRDLYHHQVDPADPDLYQTSSGRDRFATMSESIDVAGAAAVDHVFRMTADGQPIVNDLIPPVSADSDGPISLRWVGQEQIGDVQVLLDLGRAQSVEAAVDVFGQWRMSVWNSVVADAEGHVAYQMCGSVPKREIPTRGTRPAEELAHQWDGYWNTPVLPGECDPERGWVASANNPAILPGTEPPLYGTYADGYRYDRIARYLDGATLTAEQVGALQADNLSVRAQDLSGAVARQLDVVASQFAEGSQDAGITGEMACGLRAWNHCFDADQVGASIWSVLWPRLVEAVGHHVLPAFVAELNAGNAGRLTRHLLLNPDGAPRIEAQRGIGAESELGTGPRRPSDADADTALNLVALTAAAAAEAAAYLRQVLGDDVSRWRWDRLQSMRMHHPLSRNDAARRVFDPPVIPCDGGSGVVHNRAARETPTGLEVTGGPSYRLVADLSTPHAMGCLLSGQSGQPGHRHYADQLALWPSGQWHPLCMDLQRIEDEAACEFSLKPA